jgi:hypothetical protein
MSKSADGEAKLRGAKAPRKSSRPRGEPQRTEAQEAAYRKLIDDLKIASYRGDGFSLALNRKRGEYATALLERREAYGANTLKMIADDLGVKSLTLRSAIDFFRLIDASVQKQLEELRPPPSWRMMAQWARIKDSNKKQRDQILSQILSGELSSDGFESRLREMLHTGPRQPRRPSGAAATLKKVCAEALTMAAHLPWIDNVERELAKETDTPVRRDMRLLAKDAMEKLEALREKLDATIIQMKALA